MKENELKDGIKKVVDAFFEDWECPSNDVYSESIAQRIADALVVDEDELNKITCDACGCGYCDTCRRIIKAISNAKPIKCEVG